MRNGREMPEGWAADDYGPKNEEARSFKAGFCRERRYANLGHLLPIVYFGRAVKPGVSALPVR